MSDAFDVSLGKVDLSKYVDELADELTRIVKEVGPGKTEAEVQAGKKRIEGRIEDLLGRQAASLAKETGVVGNYALVFMLMSSILMTAWTSFTIKRTLLDTTRPFEERLRLEELLSNLPVALSQAISRSAEHADMYGKK